VTANPLHAKLPRLPEEVGYVPPMSEVQALLRACRRDTCEGRRDHTLVMLAFDTGLRANELRTLHLADVNEQERVLRVGGKARPGQPPAVRYVPLSPAGLRALHAYLNVRARIPGDVLFCDRHGLQLPRRSFCAIIERLRRRARITTKLSWHSLRRAFTTESLRAGCPEEILRRILGHKDLRMLARYTALHTSDLVRFHDQVSPSRFLSE
jgi:site-specific recombinase XerD